MTYELIVTAVSERADLLARTLQSFRDAADIWPSRILVHEDVKPGSRPGEIARFLDGFLALTGAAYTHLVRDPAAGLGPAIARLLHEARAPIVFYTSEDFDYLRPVPVGRALALMQRHGLHHIAFGKEPIPAAQHPGQADEWRNVVIDFDGQPLTVAQYWRATAALWRVDRIRPFFDRLVAHDSEPDRWAMRKVNRWMNTAFLGDEAGNDHAARRQILRTFLFGGIGEPAFIRHTGGNRRAELQSIHHHGAPQ